MKNLILIIPLLLMMGGCDDNTRPICYSSKDNNHTWGKWDLVPTPDNYNESTIVQTHTCELCGYTESLAQSPSYRLNEN